tara:strand:- start:312 stop:593 length:282 start_codon:yes stop_codon:yes gene_type:complete
MNRLENLRDLFSSIFHRRGFRKGEMKRVFQWRRYLEWSDLTPEERLAAKRFLLIPVFAYLIIELFNKTFSFIVLLLIIYTLYKKYEKGGIVKK